LLLVFFQVVLLGLHFIRHHISNDEDDMVFKSVFGVVSDTGSWNTLYPVLLEAVQDGRQVEVHMSGASARQFRAGRMPHLDPRLRVTLEPKEGNVDDKETSVERLASFIVRRHWVTVVGASTSVEGSLGATLALCTSKAASGSLLVEDRYASALPTLQSIPTHCPARAHAPTICVSDRIAESLIASHTSFKGRVVVTGAPMFDREIQLLHSSESAQANQRRRVRDALGVQEEELLVLLAGQSAGTTEVLQVVLDAVKLLQTETLMHKAQVKVLVRPHPRAPAEDLQAVRALTLAAPLGLVFSNTSALAHFATSDSLVPGADVVVSGYSTTNYYAILWKVPGVVYVGTEILKKKFWKDKHLDMVPEVKEGAAWEVTTPETMKHVINHVQTYMKTHLVSPQLENIFNAQERLCKYHDGFAAKRVWAIISSS